MIFYNQKGPPIRFFLQKDGPDEERRAIEAIILEEGGMMSDKIVKKGYVVLFMDTPEANRIVERWTDPEHPQRFIVSTDWVRACKASNQLLCQIFVDNGIRVKIHIHSTIANIGSREELARKITLHGGDPNVSVEDATVILSSRETMFFKETRSLFQGREDKFVEHITWVDNCVDQNFYHHSPNPIKSLGGRRAGDERTPFTEEDEFNLCKYIACVLPYKETGGRTGNRIYMELIEAAQKSPDMKWALRHTWQSWRERYKKNKDRLDKHISAVVSNAMTNGTQPFSQDKDTASQASTLNIIASVPDNEGMMMVESTQVTQATSESEGFTLLETHVDAPSWTKRKTVETNQGRADPKRLRTADSSFHTFVLTPSPAPALTTAPSVSSRHPSTPISQSGHASAPWDQVEEEVQTIAQDFRFFADEVRSYYTQTGNLAATRRRFEQIRTFIDSFP